MWFVWIYLVAYFSLLAGAVVALWRAGALSTVSPLWTAAGLISAVVLGVLLALLFVRRPVQS